ncbi:MAG: DUF4138 domain-containing protein [Bacteroidota bacterium]
MRYLVLLFILPLFVVAQKRIPVSKEDFTILVFEEPVLDSEPNNDEFVVFPATGNGAFKQNGKMLKVKANKLSEGKKEATLLVITRSNRRHEIILYHEPKPEKFNYYFDAGLPLFKSRKNQAFEEDQQGTITVRKKAYRELPKWVDTVKAKSINKKPAWLGRGTTKNQGIYFTNKGTYHGTDAIYIALSIRNESGQRYELKFINYSKVPKTKGKGAVSSEPINKRESFEFQLPENIMPDTEVHFVAVLKRFTLNSKRDVLIEISENNGERTIQNRIAHTLINNPKRMNP